MSKIDLLNIKVDNLTMNQAIERIDELILEKKNSYIVTPNIDCIIKVENDAMFKEIYEHADLVLTDGKPLIWISKIKRNPIVEKVSGSDLFPKVCELAAKKQYKIFILGAKEGVAEEAAIRLRRQYSKIQVVDTLSPSFGFEKNIDEIQDIISRVKKANPDILVISLGSPKGEKFLYKYKEQLGVPISMQVGAAVDFIAGNVKRAPKWMSDCGLEWLYRTVQEPRRLAKRYIYDFFAIIPILWKYRRKNK